MQFLRLKASPILKKARIALFSSLKQTHSFNLAKVLFFTAASASDCFYSLITSFINSWFSLHHTVFQISPFRALVANPMKRRAPKPSTLLTRAESTPDWLSELSLSLWIWQWVSIICLALSWLGLGQRKIPPKTMLWWFWVVLGFLFAFKNSNSSNNSHFPKQRCILRLQAWEV